MGDEGAGGDNRRVIRLDYDKLGSGPLMIVIDGMPDTRRVHMPEVSRLARPQGGAPAAALLEEAGAVSGAGGHPPDLYTSLVLAAWRGQEARALELIDAAIQDAPAGSEREAAALADYARAILYNGLGRYGDAFAAACRVCANEGLCPLPWALSELAEAGARSGNPDAAAGAMRLRQRGKVAGSDGVEALSRALHDDGGSAEASFLEAIDLFRSAGPTLRLARAQLLYGEWLRRRGRRVHARAQLRAAEAAFAHADAAGFAERARRELLATAETARRRTVQTRDDLTAQEAQIAQFAADGRTNPEIGAQLFISPRTVEWHLRKVFRKLQVGSRRELRVALQGARPRVPVT